MNWTLHPDGSFDLSIGAFVVCGAYPAIDSVPVRPTGVEILPAADGGTIRYRLADGALTVTLGTEADGPTLRARLEGFADAPHSVWPLAGAEISGATRVFRQGHGMGGGSRVIDWPPAAPTDSFGITALIAADEAALVVSTRDHVKWDHRCQMGQPAGAIGAEAKPRLAAGFLTENVPLPGGACDFPTIHFVLGASPAAALRSAAEAIAAAMHARPARHPMPTAYHWCSWYYLYHNLSQTILEEYLDGFAKLQPPSPLQTIQIDAGYFPSCGDWLEPNALWPGGLAKAFETIRRRGYKPGIWIAPFMVGNRSRLFREHPDWMLRGADGKPLPLWRCYNEPKIWGYRDEETYALDTSHPDAMAYLRQVFRTLRQWGAEYFKTDFLFWGLHDSSAVRRHQPGKTSVEYLRDVMMMIRQEIGAETFWLGCIAPFLPMVGFCDGMRVGGDIGSRWSGGFNPQSMLVESVGNQHVNNVFWQNDPDAILLRDFHIELTDVEIPSLALWQGILGGVVNTSDPLHEIRADRLALWRFLAPSGKAWTAGLPYFGRTRKLLVAVRDFADGGHAVLAFNTADEPVTELLHIRDLVGRESLFAFDWHYPQPGRPEVSATALGRQTCLLPELPPHAAQLFFLGESTAGPGGRTLGGE